MLPFSHLTPAFHPLAAGFPDSLQKIGSVTTSVLSPGTRSVLPVALPSALPSLSGTGQRPPPLLGPVHFQALWQLLFPFPTSFPGGVPHLLRLLPPAPQLQELFGVYLSAPLQRLLAALECSWALVPGSGAGAGGGDGRRQVNRSAVL